MEVSLTSIALVRIRKSNTNEICTKIVCFLKMKREENDEAEWIPCLLC